MRSEQDIDFERALEADRQVREAAESERRQREAEVDAAQNQAELEAALEISVALNREAALRRARERLSAEPPAGPDTTKLRLQLPNGSKIDRRFLATSTLQGVRDYLTVYFGENDLVIESYSLSTNFPRKSFEDNAISLRDAGLHPQSVLYVQDLEA